MHALVERLLRRVRRRVVQVRDGLRESPQLPRLSRPRWKRFAKMRRIAHQRPTHQLAQRVLRQSRRRRIDRRQAVRKRRSRVDDLKPGMNHFQTGAAFADVAEGAHTLAGSERPVLTRIEMKETQQQLRVALFDQAYELPPAAVLNLGMDDGALDLPCLTGLERAQRAKVGAILVTQWQMKHEVLL